MASSSSTTMTIAALASPAASSASSPCAACKFLRRKCQSDCVFAPYFPPDKPQRFVNVHRVFGASNVTKILNDLHPFQREDAVNSLAYEADARLRDPVYGCVGIISNLQNQLSFLQVEIGRAKSELAKYQPSFATSAAAVAPFPSGLMFNINNNGGGHPAGAGQFFLAQPAAVRDQLVQQHNNNMMMMMMRHGFESGNMAAAGGRIGGGGGDAYNAAGIMAAMKGSSGGGASGDNVGVSPVVLPGHLMKPGGGGEGGECKPAVRGWDHPS